MLCDQYIPCMTFSTHDKPMAINRNLTPNLHFLPPFNYNQLLFATFLLYTKNLLTLKIFSIESYHACLNVGKVGIFF
jgi:hypothetical protein